MIEEPDDLTAVWLAAKAENDDTIRRLRAEVEEWKAKAAEKYEAVWEANESLNAKVEEAWAEVERLRDALVVMSQCGQHPYWDGHDTDNIARCVAEYAQNLLTSGVLP